MNSLFFGLDFLSPTVCLERTLLIGLGDFGTRCNDHSLGSTYLFGGPIIYFVLQRSALFGILNWWDSTTRMCLPTFRSRKKHADGEARIGRMIWGGVLQCGKATLDEVFENMVRRERVWVET